MVDDGPIPPADASDMHPRVYTESMSVEGEKGRVFREQRSMTGWIATTAWVDLDRLV